MERQVHHEDLTVGMIAKSIQVLIAGKQFPLLETQRDGPAQQGDGAVLPTSRFHLRAGGWAVVEASAAALANMQAAL
jgi:hypothetical protein